MISAPAAAPSPAGALRCARAGPRGVSIMTSVISMDAVIPRRVRAGSSPWARSLAAVGGIPAQRAFRLLFAARSISSLGDRLVPVALAFAVLNLTGSATSLGVVLAAQTIPLVLFVLVGGVWADR